MPNLVHAVPKYRKHRASGQALVTLNGRDHYLGPHGTKASKVEYDRLIGEYLAAGRAVSYGHAGELVTLIELAADYLSYAKSYYGTAKTSEFHRVKPLIRLLADNYGRQPAAHFGTVQLRALRDSLVQKGHCRTAVNHAVRRLVRMFRWGVSEGHLPAAVPNALSMVPALRRGRTVARETDPIVPVDESTVEATLLCLSTVVGDMVRLQRLTGARPAEICILRPRDLDRSGDVWIYRPDRHKTQYLGRERTIYIGPKAQTILIPYLSRDADEKCFRPVDATAAHRAKKHAARKTPLSCGNAPGTNRKAKPRKSPGLEYSPDSYRRAIHNACDKAFPHPHLAGIPVKLLTPEQLSELKKWKSEHRWSPNQLRHAAATAIRKDFGLEAAQVILGHSEANVTQIYAERDLAKGIEVAKLVG